MVEETVSFDGDLRRRGGPFGFAQGRLSTSFGWRLTFLTAQRRWLDRGEYGGSCEKQTKALREGANVMLIIGCDFHPGFRQIAIFDNQTASL